MSVSSSKTTVTTDRPYLDSERTSSTRGIPAMARSTGTVTYCSISTGDSAGEVVITCTCTLVTSGTASMGRVMAARIPAATSRMLAAMTMARWRSDQLTVWLSRCNSLLLAEGALEDGALQGEDPVHDDALALAQPGQDLHPATRGAPQLHRVDLEVPIGLQHEHHVLVGDLGDRGQRHHHPLRAAALFGHHPSGAEQDRKSTRLNSSHSQIS